MSQMGQYEVYTGVPVVTLTGDIGGAVSSNAVGNITFTGTAPLSITGNPGAHTLTFALATPLTVGYGGTGINTLTDHAILVGSGAAAITAIGPGATNQVLLGATAADPVWGAVPNAALTNSTITLNSGNNITVTGSPVALGGAAGIAVTGTTQYTVQVGNATGSLTSLATGAATQILQSGGAAANPAWSTATYPATTLQGDVLYSSANNTVAGLAKNATATRYISNTGAANNPAWAQVDLTNGVTGALPVGNGGTGATTLADHGILLGSATAAVTATAAPTDGQLLIGHTGADPDLATLTEGTGITVTNASGSITITSTGVVPLTLNLQTGTSYQLVLADASKLVSLTNAAAITLTVPANATVAFPTGTQILLYQGGAGTVTVAAGGGVTINSANGLMDLFAQYSVASLVKLDTNVWSLFGDLA